MEPDTPLIPEERDRWLDRAAREVVRRRLEVPATLVLEMHRPLSFLSSQAMIVLTPLLAPAFGLRNLERLTRVLAEPENLDRLLDRIEELAHERELPRERGGGKDVPPSDGN